MKLCAIIICIVISAIAYAVCYRQFREKGILLNNAYLFSSLEERKRMNKKPYYRQSGVVFGAIGTVFMLNALSMITEFYEIFPLIMAICVVTVLYAIFSSVWIALKK